MNKSEFKTLEEIKRLNEELLADVRHKEIEIAKLEVEIRSIYNFINQLQYIGEIESIRLDTLKEAKNE